MVDLVLDCQAIKVLAKKDVRDFALVRYAAGEVRPVRLLNL